MALDLTLKIIQILQPRPQGHLCFQDGGWAQRRPWRRAGHVSPKILEIFIVSKWRWARDWLMLWSRDLPFARVFFVPTHNLESGDGPGDEVANTYHLKIL